MILGVERKRSQMMIQCNGDLINEMHKAESAYAVELGRMPIKLAKLHHLRSPYEIHVVLSTLEPGSQEYWFLLEKLAK